MVPWTEEKEPGANPNRSRQNALDKTPAPAVHLTLFKQKAGDCAHSGEEGARGQHEQQMLPNSLTPYLHDFTSNLLKVKKNTTLFHVSEGGGARPEDQEQGQPQSGDHPVNRDHPATESPFPSAIQGTTHPTRSALGEVRIDHGGPQVLVSRKGLHRADVRPRLEQVGGKTMSKNMAGDPLRDAAGPCNHLDLPLQGAVMDMPSDNEPGMRIGAGPGRGEQVLPPRLEGRPERLRREGKGQVHPPGPWHHHHSIHVPLAVLHHDGLRVEIKVFDPQAEALGQPQSASIKQPGHEGVPRRHPVQQHPDIRSREDLGKAPGPPGPDKAVLSGDLHPQDLAVQEHHRAQSLVLSRSGDSSLRGQIIKKFNKFRMPQLPGMPHPRERDVPHDPRRVRLLGSFRVVTPATRGMNLLHERHENLLQVRSLRSQRNHRAMQRFSEAGQKCCVFCCKKMVLQPSPGIRSVRSQPGCLFPRKRAMDCKNRNLSRCVLGRIRVAIGRVEGG